METKIEQVLKEAKQILINNNTRIDTKKIIKGLLNKKIVKKDYLFWPNALIIYGLILNNDNDTKKIIKEQLELVKKKKYTIYNYDDSLMIYLFMKYNKEIFIDDTDVIKNNMLNKIEKYRDTIIPYRDSAPSEIFIDLLGMIPPFLCKCGENDEEFIDWAILQFDSFIKNGFDKEFKLPFHSYNLENEIKNGIVGWSRSLGWILFGLSECIDCLYNNNDFRYKKLLDYYTDILDTTIKYIRDDGGYSWQIITREGHLDTSGTAMILLSMLTLKNKNIINNKYDQYIKKNISCLNENIVDGKIINCSAECRGIGLYPQIYGSYAWSVGPTLCCMILYNKIFNKVRG